MEKNYQPAPEGEGPLFPWIEGGASTLPPCPGFPFVPYDWFNYSFSPLMALDPTNDISVAPSTALISCLSCPVNSSSYAELRCRKPNLELRVIMDVLSREISFQRRFVGAPVFDGIDLYLYYWIVQHDSILGTELNLK